MTNGKIPPCGYVISREGNEEVMKVNCINCNYCPSIEDNPVCMAKTIDKLVESPSVARIIFSQSRNYDYGYDQTQTLIEIANLYSYLVKQKKLFNLTNMGYTLEYPNHFSNRLATVQYITLNLLRSDPIGAYVELLRTLREEKISLRKERVPLFIKDRQVYITLLEELKALFDRTRLVTLVAPYLEGYQIGDRSVYRMLFRPSITPNFMFTRLMADPPLNGEQLDMYKVKGIDVAIYKIPGEIKYLYHVTPPEFKISEEKYELLDLARNVLSEHKPRAEEFLDPDRMRKTFFNIGRDMLQELAESRRVKISFEEIEELARILVRYTVGFGLIEILLRDPKIQDISINGPIGQTPIYIIHQDYEECMTNIIPSSEDGESWATKLRLTSGRPLDEANPVLDTELLVPGARARVAAITRPLNPVGLAYSLRRHRDDPWTLPLFIKNRMITPLAAGLVSFLVDGGRTLLFAGTRSGGKTSMLSASMVEIMRKYRVITVEDTLELPVRSLKDLGYNIQPLKVRSALTSAGNELSADEGIRTSLRMGDSCLIVGEVRSVEAKALYEAMRVGALANVVAGTIHGASPYGVFDRVVNDLQVPKTSFKATDIILVANPIKSPDGLRKWRRITQITEVRKQWEDDPLKEKGFVDLMKYNPVTDMLEPTDDLINGNSEVLKDIAGNIKDWAGDWDALWGNIILRAKMKENLVNMSDKLKRNDLLEADFVIKANDEFHTICNEVKEDTGILDTKKILFLWNDWLKKEVKLGR